MRDIVSLRDELATMYDNVKANKVDADQAKMLTNVAGKIIGSLRVELEYAALNGEEPDIEFLKKSKKKARK